MGFCSWWNVSQYTRGALFVQSLKYFITGMALYINNTISRLDDSSLPSITESYELWDAYSRNMHKTYNTLCNSLNILGGKINGKS